MVEPTIDPPPPSIRQQPVRWFILERQPVNQSPVLAVANQYSKSFSASVRLKIDTLYSGERVNIHDRRRRDEVVYRLAIHPFTAHLQFTPLTRYDASTPSVTLCKLANVLLSSSSVRDMGRLRVFREERETREPSQSYHQIIFQLLFPAATQIIICLFRN